jgi:chorismate mutase/prephenate dehydratase
MFSIKDRVGALHDMLLPFRKHGINLTKIESRPSKKKAWDYYFFVDLEGHRNSPRVKKALLELENKCKFIKILGSYPVGEGEQRT